MPRLKRSGRPPVSLETSTTRGASRWSSTKRCRWSTVRSRTGFALSCCHVTSACKRIPPLAGAVGRGIDHRSAQIVAGGHLERGVEIADQQVAPMGPGPGLGGPIWASR